MKKLIYLLLITLITLFSCKSKKKTTISVPLNNQKSISEIQWSQISPSVPNEDLLDKYPDSTQKYWHGEGNVFSIWIDETNDNHLLISLAFGGLFETFDAGDNWICLTNNIPVHNIGKIEVKNNVIYISSGYRFKNPIRFSTVRREFYGLGVIHSKDGGKTWHQPKVNFYGADFSSGQTHHTIYAISTQKVYKSDDDGITFKNIADFSKTDLTRINDNMELQNIVVHPNDPNIAFITAKRAQDNNAKIFFKTIDGGKTWINQTNLLTNFVTDLPKDAVGYFIKDAATYYNEKNNKLWVHFSVAFQYKNKGSDKLRNKIHNYIISSDDFNTFRFNSNQMIHGGNHFSPKIYEKDNVLYLLAWYLQIRQPNQTKFENVGNGKVHQDCRAVAIDSKGIIYYGNDAGLVKSYDKGKTWVNAYKQLNANLVNEMGYYTSKTERRFAIGTQDCGYYLYNFDNKPKYPIATHEGGIYISPHNKDRIYVKDNRVSVTIDGGKKFKPLKLNKGKPTRIMHPDGLLLEDPIDQNTLYIGHYNGLQVSTSLGSKDSWVNITPKNGNNGRSIDLAIPKSNNNIMYLANRLVTFPIKKGGYNTYKTQGHLMKTTNKGKTWTKISSQFDKLLTNSVISDVEVDDDNPDRVWFTLRNLTQGEKVYYSENGGKTWKNISHNLPNVPVNRIEYNQKSKQLYLANDYGVYYLENNAWIDYGKDLPKVIITGMVIDYNFNELIVSTFGRGIWKNTLK